MYELTMGFPMIPLSSQFNLAGRSVYGAEIHRQERGSSAMFVCLFSAANYEKRKCGTMQSKLKKKKKLIVQQEPPFRNSPRFHNISVVDNVSNQTHFLYI